MAREAGKGSGRRQSAVSKEIIDSNWDRIFGDKNTDDVSFMKEQAVLAKVSEEIFDPYLTINS